MERHYLPPGYTFLSMLKVLVDHYGDIETLVAVIRADPASKSRLHACDLDTLLGSKGPVQSQTQRLITDMFTSTGSDTEAHRGLPEEEEELARAVAASLAPADPRMPHEEEEEEELARAVAASLAPADPRMPHGEEEEELARAVAASLAPADPRMPHEEEEELARAVAASLVEQRDTPTGSGTAVPRAKGGHQSRDVGRTGEGGGWGSSKRKTKEQEMVGPETGDVDVGAKEAAQLEEAVTNDNGDPSQEPAPTKKAEADHDIDPASTAMITGPKATPIRKRRFEERAHRDDGPTHNKKSKANSEGGST